MCFPQADTIIDAVHNELFKIPGIPQGNDVTVVGGATLNLRATVVSHITNIDPAGPRVYDQDRRRARSLRRARRSVPRQKQPHRCAGRRQGDSCGAMADTIVTL